MQTKSDHIVRPPNKPPTKTDWFVYISAALAIIIIFLTAVLNLSH